MRRAQRRLAARASLTRDAVALFGEQQVARARRYRRPLYLAALAGIALDLVVLGLAAFGPLGDVLFRPVERWPWWAQVVGLTALVEALTAAVALPLAFWTEFVRERRWGFSTQRSLAEANLSDLDPPRLVYLAFFTHPTPVERIEAARRLAAGT